MMSRYRLITLGLAAVMLASVSAVSEAADAGRPPAYRPPPPPIPYFTWTGFYAGAHVGPGGFDGGGGGLVGGGQVGYNFQINPQWVLGVEGEFSGTTIGSSVSGGGLSVRAGIDWVSTLAPRVGYAFDRWLIYGKAGGAWIHGSADISAVGIGSISFNGTTSGWMVGVGAEYALRGNWTVKGEFDTMDFGGGSNFNVFKAGLNYRFGGPGGFAWPFP
jgi:outer membrane immunogenic protein